MRPLRLGLLFLVAVAAAPAPAALAQGEDSGRAILNAVEEGDRACGDVSRGEFEAVGEYLMGRMAGGPGAHRDMDGMMRSLMGARGERAAHTQMGQRFAGCGGGPLGGMMGMMMGAGATMGQRSGMMGDEGRMRGGYGDERAPFDGDRRELSGADDDWHGEDTAMVALMALLLILVGGALWLLRPGRGTRRADAPLEILARRFAAGQIDQEDYDRRRQALGGTR